MEQDNQENYGIDSDESRRSFMKKGALASSALALGIGASGTAAAQQQATSALVFTYDFATNRRFTEVARLQQTTTRGILQDVVDQPDEWSGFIGRYQETEEDPGEFFLTFTRGGSLGTGQFGADVTFFAARSNLLVAGINEVDEETTTPEEETTPPEEEETTLAEEETTTPAEEETTTPAEEETTTPAEETTEEVVVETTTTETNGG